MSVQRYWSSLGPSGKRVRISELDIFLFRLPLPDTAASVAPGCGLKVACVSAAVSDESVAGDSGVYEASAQRWVPGCCSVLGESVSSGCSSPSSTGCGGAAEGRFQ